MAGGSLTSSSLDRKYTDQCLDQMRIPSTVRQHELQSWGEANDEQLIHTHTHTHTDLAVQALQGPPLQPP